MDWNRSNYSSTDSTLPAVNVMENENEFRIDVAAPGMTKEDFNVSYNEGCLVISSEHKNNSETMEGEKITRREFSYQSFQRSFTVSDAMIEVENISANYENGILHITLPKREEVRPKPARSIEIL